MYERTPMQRTRSVLPGTLLASVLIFGPTTVLGQTPAPVEAAAPSSPGQPISVTNVPSPPPPVPPGPPPAPASAPAEIPLGTVPKGPVPAAPPPAMPNIDYGGRLRSAIRLQGVGDPKAFNDIAATLYLDLYAGGQINKMWKWLLAITSGEYGGSAGQTSTVSMSVLDAMAGFTPLPEFQLYVGRMLVMADRYAPSGPWSMDQWFYPGFFVGTPPAVPKAGPAGRDVGVTAWGVPLGGHVKYYLGAYQLQDPTSSPLISGRVQVSLLSPEPGWFHRTTYYGDRDLVSIGIGGQMQKRGSVMTVPPATMGMMPPAPMVDDYREFNADLIVEKRIGAMGALSFEGAYYNFQGAYQPWTWSMVGSIAYNSPVLAGIGKLRPSFRYQQAQARQVTAAGEKFDPTKVYDLQLTYSPMHWFVHVVVNYRHYDVVYASPSGAAPAAQPAHSTGNMIVLGVQLWDP
jgi:hypothetical protein